MFKHILSMLLKRNGRFTVNPQNQEARSSIFREFVFAPIATNNHEHQQVPPLFTKDGQRLLFIDPHLTDKELKEIYGDALNN
jgi:hypothetical protein